MLKASLETSKRDVKFRTIGSGCALQRLFSTFPDRLPGFGLLLLRLCVGLTLIYLGAAGLLKEISAPTSFLQSLITAAAGLFLLVGLWTPIAATLAALDQVWIALSISSSQRPWEWLHILVAVLCASVGMLGPGAWSIDARLFGRKRLYGGRSRGGRRSP